MQILFVYTFLLFLRIGCSSSINSCQQACKELQVALPGNRVQVTAKQNAYWASQIQSIQGACYAYPASSHEVATVLKTVSKYQCSLAIKGGGHSDVANASNIAGGIILNLDAFNDVSLSADKTYAIVGAGNSWGDVYGKLDPLNHTVVGGRETTVGVGGLTLGGGISFFSGAHGFACDNVLGYEAVLANGTIKTVTQHNAPDLYRALRGGGNNFAVVTHFHLATFKYNLLQGGLEIYADANNTQAELLSAFTQFTQNAQNSPDANMIISLAFVNGVPLWITDLTYTKPSPPIPTIPVFTPFYSSQLNASRISSSRRTSNQTDFATELGNTSPNGKREQFHTGTYVANLQLLNDIYNGFRSVVANMQPQLHGASETFTPALAFQPITHNMLAAQQQRGGNVLGLAADSPPLVLMSMSWPWSDAQHDNLFNKGMQDVVDTADAFAIERGYKNDFIYMNYAPTGAQVLQSYGADNVQYMRQVSAKYDPAGVFQKLVPGGFKIP